MRLTLRTMLAFLDDLLEPADAQEVGKRIEESEFAASLMHRTRDVTRRLRLGAPKLEGRGMGLDPNTVAEYLDHALPPERVPDFEKVCLESDVHLAEVASAHQILALVLGEPAEVDPQMRRRMYAVAAQAQSEADETEHEQTDETPQINVAKAPSRRAAKRARRRPEVPDYLRDQSRRRRWLPWVAAALVLILVGGGIAIVLGPMQGWRMLALGPATDRTDNVEVPVSPDAAAGPTTDDGAHESGKATRDGADAPPTATPDADSTSQPMPKDATAPKAVPPELISPEKTSPQSPPRPADESPAAPIPSAATPSTPVPSAPSPPAPMPPDSKSPLPGTPSPAAPMPAAQLPGPAPDKTSQPPMPAPMPPDATGQPKAPDVPPRPAAEAVGSLATDVEVLLRLDRKLISPTHPASQAWQRVSSRELLYPGDDLIVLPTFRTNLVFSGGGGVKAQVLGGAILTLEAPDPQGVPGIRVHEGRLIIMPTGKPETQLRLLVGQQQGMLVFGDADATVAIDVRRLLEDGADPETSPSQLSVDLYVPAGEVRWIPAADAAEDAIKAPGHRVLGPTAQQFQAVPAVAKDLPEWIAGTGPSGAEKRTAEEFEKELAIGKLVHLRLKEIAFRDRRYDYRSLAARCLFQIGDFETFLPLLSDATQKSYWTTQIEAVRAAMARGPETATAIHNTMTNQRDLKTADELYRMLWGYTRDELRENVAARLVDELDHQSLDVRVLAFWNLYHVTGYTLNYLPQDTQAKRQLAVRRWKQKLDDDQIVPK